MTTTRNYHMRVFHAQLNKLGLMEDKAEMIHEFTEGRTGSARELTDQELRHLSSSLAQGAVVPPGDKMRKAIISMAHEMGWRMAGKADMQRINNWCVASGKFHKKLNSHNLKELTELVSQFKIMYEKHLKQV